ncbi:hypothetical protein MUN89_02015 [Halobacillus salinarum]|uniref:Uncharacterized protein n=1 Tax=Halobacillus salinarum TaxID=2932257 RepID=A0ABY4ERK8_9BACI|nr:hypothetical protein [Halobacillus salinarum]UOQ44756.1 hypothetical protein MUN89_02015 [Halobacillus salinarum]
MNQPQPFDGYNAATLSEEQIKEIQQLEEHMKSETSEDIILIAYKHQ